MAFSANLIVASSIIVSLVASGLAAAAAGLLIYVALGNQLPQLTWKEPVLKADGPSFLEAIAEAVLKWAAAQRRTKDSGPSTEAAGPSTKVDEPDVDPRMADWDSRFAATPRRLRLEDLSPASAFSDLRDFAKQEGLLLKTGGRSKEDVYAEIAAIFRSRSSE
ncbi:unnamed protein product [Polarella glacialis]|uniref:Uncharacterized protein n=1 Tax=Polarella glacialis TaxID=89957 RepID=A0A813JDH0_POLGL|nr:unnamed protein product [Polarella glacialis]